MSSTNLNESAGRTVQVRPNSSRNSSPAPPPLLDTYRPPSGNSLNPSRTSTASGNRSSSPKSPRKKRAKSPNSDRENVKSPRAKSPRSKSGKRSKSPRRRRGGSASPRGLPRPMDVDGSPRPIMAVSPTHQAHKINNLKNDENNNEKHEGCPFIDFGCEFTNKRENIREHIKGTFNMHLEQLRLGVIELRDDLDSFTLSHERTERFNEDITYRIAQLSNKFSSNLVWRIDDYSELMKDAKSGKRSIIFSPPFYSGRNGYYMAISMALYGDGDSKGKYNAIFVTILKGEYDALLHWPFLCPITFTLIEQRRDDKVKNAVHVLRPAATKKNRPFLGRPFGARNPSFGVQQFVELNEMRTRSYVRDDAIFIRVDIDTSDLVMA